MPLNPYTVKKRSLPERRASLDSRYRVPLPRDMGWKVGSRVYFSLATTASAWGEPPGVVITIKPWMSWQGRLASGRIRQNGFAPLIKMRRRPRPNWQ